MKKEKGERKQKTKERLACHRITSNDGVDFMSFTDLC